MRSKKAFPGRTIVADMKTMDVGGFEVEIAVKAGADVVTVLGLSDDATISESGAHGPPVRSQGHGRPDERAGQDGEGQAARASWARPTSACTSASTSRCSGTRRTVGSGQGHGPVRGDTSGRGWRASPQRPTLAISCRRALASSSWAGASSRPRTFAAATRRGQEGHDLRRQGRQGHLQEVLARTSCSRPSPRSPRRNIADAQHKRGVMSDIHPHIAHGQAWSVGRSPSRRPRGIGPSRWRPSTGPRRATSSSSTPGGATWRSGASWPP